MDDSFDLLEQKVHKAAELVTRLRKENRTLGEEASKAKASLQDAEKKIASLQKDRSASSEQAQVAEGLKREVEHLNKERTEVRNRIAKLVELLEGLD